MHAYRRFIQETMDARRMKPADVARAGGPSNQLISRLMQDDRDILDRRPDAETIRRYAVALRVREEDVLAAVAEAMGLPLTITTARLEDVPA
ncbi:helix-turn-helix domain-containing protein, partial [Micrococcus lylae]